MILRAIYWHTSEEKKTLEKKPTFYKTITLKSAKAKTLKQRKVQLEVWAHIPKLLLTSFGTFPLVLSITLRNSLLKFFHPKFVSSIKYTLSTALVKAV